jgi:hypothetical protein
MPWRIVLTGVALVLAAILVFSTVDFGSSSSATTSSTTTSHAVVTPDAIDRVSAPATSAGLTPDAVDRVSAPSPVDTDLYACHPGKPC